MHVRQLLGYARPYRWTLALLVVLTSASSLVMLAIPWIAGRILGGIVSGATVGQGAAVGLLLGCLGAIAILNFAMSYHSTTTAARLLGDLRGRFHDHVQNLPIAFHDQSSKGDLLALMTFEITRLTSFLTGTLVAIPSRLLTTAGAIVLMFGIDARLALVVPVLVPAFYIILKLVGRRLRGLAVSLQQADARVVWLAEESLDILPATKAFVRENAQSARFRAAVGESVNLATREGRIYAAIEPLIGLIAAVAALLVLLLAGQSVRAGEMTSAELFSFLLYAALLTRPISALSRTYGQVQTARGTLTRLQRVFDAPPEPGLAEFGSVGRAKGEIRFQDVRFVYPGREQTLTDVNLRIAAGETVALVGPNGAGKTAMMNLLLRFYDLQSGTILLDGKDIARLSVTDLRRQIGLVPQMPMLFNGTIRENIAFGFEGAAQRQVDEAARLAQARDFIAALPHGMDTEIGDRGVRLSGGQRQRIALARALIKDPPILIFDEATSMFDDEGESGFIAACSDALAGRTVILITHRPATLALADRVFVVDDGKVTEAPGQARTAKARA